ncbi:hypothetical protein JEQ12_015354 [Ovis aries]|uniref:Uncharacterized protein n=1 Tax=Ovis aries TaxID=9940 RepID=A0A836A4Q4_SHEEP|nr:hypothetical protein JEQ12_015354 [Ovis aries]
MGNAEKRKAEHRELRQENSATSQAPAREGPRDQPLRFLPVLKVCGFPLLAVAAAISNENCLALAVECLRFSFPLLPPGSPLAIAMGYGDLKSPAGLQVLNDHLADKSHIECHITSYEKGKASLSGVKKALGKYGPANVADTAESGATDGKDDDDGIDHFGSEEEEEREEAKG